MMQVARNMEENETGECQRLGVRGSAVQSMQKPGKWRVWLQASERGWLGRQLNHQGITGSWSILLQLSSCSSMIPLYDGRKEVHVHKSFGEVGLHHICSSLLTWSADVWDLDSQESPKKIGGKLSADVTPREESINCQ
jgi:hypothetical protein